MLLIVALGSPTRKTDSIQDFHNRLVAHDKLALEDDDGGETFAAAAGGFEKPLVTTVRILPVVSMGKGC